MKEIREINKKMAPLEMGWIPPDEGPVVAEVLPNDRIIPSIRMMQKEGLLLF